MAMLNFAARKLLFAEQLPKFILGDDLDAQFPRLLQFASGFFPGKNKTGLLAQTSAYFSPVLNDLFRDFIPRLT